MSAGAHARILDEKAGVRAMTGVMAVMLFLLVLAAALGLGALAAARTLDRQLAGRLTVRIVEGDPQARDRAAALAAAVLRGTPEVARARSVPRAELERLVEPWLGEEARSAALPIPALIDVDLVREDAFPRVAATLRRAVPAARVDRHEAWMSPVDRFMDLVVALAAVTVALVAGAALAVVALAVRGGLEAHRETIEVMHMLGSTDVQVARLFQRRIALDAALGGGVGGLAALAATWVIGGQLGALGSELLGGAALGRGEWIALALLPLLFVALAAMAARRAVLSHLKRTL